MAHSPARQNEPDADQGVRQEEDHQIKVQLGVQVPGLLQRHKSSVVPGISRYQEDDHEDEEHPGTESIDLDEKSASVQLEFTIRGIAARGLKLMVSTWLRISMERLDSNESPLHPTPRARMRGRPSWPQAFPATVPLLAPDLAGGGL